MQKVDDMHGIGNPFKYNYYSSLGITGTRNGMNSTQKELLIHWLHGFTVGSHNKHMWFHHGDCVGVDAESHDIANTFRYHIVIHPPEKNELRAFKSGKDVEIKEPKNYFGRNRDIVDNSQIMFGVPFTEYETKGGTWYTINYTKKKKKPLIIIYPSGKTEKINFGE